MTAIMFWVGLGAMIIGWLSDTLALVVMGAAIFIPAGIAACVIGTFVTIMRITEDEK